MLTFPPTVQLVACTSPIDMRKSFDGLAAIVESQLGHDAMSGQVFCFFNRRASHIRLLWWDSDGWLMVCKRLERGRFQAPWDGQTPTSAVWEMDPGALALILRGIDIRARRLRRWRSPKAPGQIARAGQNG